MKVINPRKAPCGRGKFSPVKDVRYRPGDDAFEVEFADGGSFLEPHRVIREANRIAHEATIARVALDDELHHGFFVHYDNGQVAEVSWALVRELPPAR
jgi:hypothetical protein